MQMTGGQKKKNPNRLDARRAEVHARQIIHGCANSTGFDPAASRAAGREKWGSSGEPARQTEGLRPPRDWRGGYSRRREGHRLLSWR